MRGFVLLLLFGYAARRASAGLHFPPQQLKVQQLSDAIIALQSSQWCVSIPRNPSTDWFQGVSATWTKAESDFCGGGNRSRYEGKLVDFAHIDDACGLFGSIAHRAADASNLAEKNGCVAVIEVQQGKKKRVPGNDYYAYEGAGFSRIVPYLRCSRIGEPQEPGGFVRDDGLDRIKLDLYDVVVNVTRDPNEFVPFFDNWFYHVWFRGWGLIYLATAFMAAKGLSDRLRDKVSVARIPEAILTVESASMTILGCMCFFGAGWADQTFGWPPALHLSWFQMLSGLIMCTSLLSGIFFADVAAGIIKVNSGQTQSFWRRKKHLIFCISGICVILDGVNAYAIVTWVPKVDMICAGINVLLQLVVGVTFAITSSKFIKVTSSAVRADTSRQVMKDDNMRGKYNQIVRLSKLLALSSAGMLAYVICVPFVAMSGSVIYGVYSALGWGLIWGLLTVVRWITSIAQILMSVPPPTTKKKKKKACASVCTDTGSSLAASSCSSSASLSSAESASLSLGSTASGSSNEGSASMVASSTTDDNGSSDMTLSSASDQTSDAA